MRSDAVKRGWERAPHRALWYATGIRKEDLNKPFVGIAPSFTDLIPVRAVRNGNIKTPAAAQPPKSPDIAQKSLDRY